MSKPSVLLLALLAASALAAPDLHTQVAPTVTTGDKLRVNAPSTSSVPLVGTLVRVRGDTCVLDLGGAAGYLLLPLDSVATVEVKRGSTWSPGPMFWTAVAGGAVGAATGAFLVAVVRTVSNEEPDYGRWMARWAAPLAAGGAVLGALAGSDDRWVPLSVAELRVARVAVRPGLMILARIRF